MRRLPDALPTEPDVRDYLIWFLGSIPFDQIISQTGYSPLGGWDRNAAHAVLGEEFPNCALFRSVQRLGASRLSACIELLEVH
jgi:hypothetical protein